MLLNLDIPLKKATLHNEFCTSVPKPIETKLKPFGRMGAEGGWFSVESQEQAEAVAKEHLREANVSRCPRC